MIAVTAPDTRSAGSLAISRQVFERMLDAAVSAAPVEACGLLAGTGRHATKFYRLTNVDASPDHFSMKPEEQFAAVKDMRARGLKLLAIWHSHPATPARMSDEDLRLAYTPEVVYVIVSLADPNGPDARGFVLREGVPAEIDLEIVKQEKAEA